MALPEILYRGSVKNIRGKQGVSPYIFEFSDRYSVFDWGEMPDHLTHKGIALANMAQILFEELGNGSSWKKTELSESERAVLKGSDAIELLQKYGLQHHSLGLVNDQGENVATGSNTPYLAVEPIQVIRPPELEGANTEGDLYDYSVYADKPRDALVPLEIIFRMGVPEGSSLLKRLNKEPAYAQKIGLDHRPQEGDLFAAPLIEFSTKLESEDRYLDYETARRIAGLSQKEFNRLYDLAVLLGLRLFQVFSQLSLELWDGKIEVAFIDSPAGDGDRFFKLVDSIGPDELRLLSDKGQLSKEYLRQFYQGSSWHNAIQLAKETARNAGQTDWKEICLKEFHQGPGNLDQSTKEIGENIYQALANALAVSLGKNKLFPTALELPELIRKMS